MSGRDDGMRRYERAVGNRTAIYFDWQQRLYDYVGSLGNCISGVEVDVEEMQVMGEKRSSALGKGIEAYIEKGESDGGIHCTIKHMSEYWSSDGRKRRVWDSLKSE